MLAAILCASPCLLILCLAAVVMGRRLDIRRRHQRAVWVMRGCAEQRELHKRTREE